MRIACLTSTRADWGLLSPIAGRLRERGHQVDVIAANMHFIPAMGNTWQEIVADGFTPAHKVLPGADPTATAALTLQGVSEGLGRLKPDCLLLLGDRYEILAGAMAAALRRVPIIHIAGGTISEGAFDDAFRHSITKLSTLHLVETDDARRRVIQMGEEPDRVITTGAIGLHNLLAIEPMSKEGLEASLGFELGPKAILATLHAATLSPAPPREQMQRFLSALDSLPQYKVIITYPNNDVDPTELIAQIEAYATRNKGRVLAISSLGRKRYLSALRYVKAVVGNSSSGLVEVPSAGIPTLDIGIRQQGRACGSSVVHCADTLPDIIRGLKIVTSEAQQALAAKKENPYFKPNTLELITSAIESYNFLSSAPKRFYDLPAASK